MLSSVIGSLGDRVDSKFLTAYWLPAFVFVFGGFCALGAAVGSERLQAWVRDFDSVEQTLGALVIVLLISMVAFILRALTRPITEVFAGVALPRFIAASFTRGQARARQRATLLVRNADSQNGISANAQAAAWLQSRFPAGDDLRPTLFGNMVASVSEHPLAAYSMVGPLWWPRLSPLLPGSFQDMLAGAQAPMMGLLNLSVVFAALAPVGVLAGVLTAQWVLALLWGVGALVLSRWAYRAAVSQAAEVGSMVRVAFDLFRFEILEQLDKPHPDDVASERLLWTSLTRELLGQDGPAPG